MTRRDASRWDGNTIDDRHRRPSLTHCGNPWSLALPSKMPSPRVSSPGDVSERWSLSFCAESNHPWQWNERQKALRRISEALGSLESKSKEDAWGHSIGRDPWGHSIVPGDLMQSNASRYGENTVDDRHGGRSREQCGNPWSFALPIASSQ